MLFPELEDLRVFDVWVKIPRVLVKAGEIQVDDNTVNVHVGKVRARNPRDAEELAAHGHLIPQEATGLIVVEEKPAAKKASGAA